MSVLRDFDGWPRGPLHLAIGVFDGVHRGHQALIARLAAGARAESAMALAATFDPLPIQVLAPGAPPSALSDADERAKLLKAAGADGVVIFSFDAAFAALTPDQFIARIKAAGEVRRIVVGPDFHFGRRAEGDIDTLRASFAVELMRPVDRGGGVVSSTRIRNALLAGDVGGAAALLGRPYALRGTVVHGSKRGRALGFPTINLGLPRERLLPRDGIYATWIELGEGRFAAAASLGVRPTFGGGERVLEAYLLDFSGDLYGETVGAAFVARLRDELAFASPAELSAQIAKDVAATREALRDS